MGSHRDELQPRETSEPVEARKLRAVIFDMGGVLMTFNALELARHFTENEEDARILSAALFERPEWALLDAGVITFDTMERVARARLPERLHETLHTCLFGWQPYSQPIPETNALAARLVDEGIDIYLLSNAGVRVDMQLDHMPAYPLMKGRIISAFERLMKPDPAIYTLACERFGLDPADCLFVDDNADNCLGARVAGLDAFHFTGDVNALEQAIAARR